MWSSKAFVICCAVVIFGSRTTSSLHVCSHFNETSGLEQLCGYKTTVQFLHSSHFDNAVKTVKTLIKYLNSCSAFANLIICSYYIPRCVSNINGPYLPCRKVCDEFNTECGNQILKYRLEWIIGACQILPKKDNRYVSEYLERCFEPPGFTTNLPVEGKKQSLKCYPLVVPTCQNIGYNYTIVNRERQKKFRQIVEQELSKDKNESTGCLAPRKTFVCTEYFPACIDEKVAIYCRQNCEDFFQKKCTSPLNYQKDNCMEFPKGNSSVGICKRTQWPRAENWFAERKRPTPRPLAITSSPSTAATVMSSPTSRYATDLVKDEQVHSSGSLIASCWSIGLGAGALALISFRSLS